MSANQTKNMVVFSKMSNEGTEDYGVDCFLFLGHKLKLLSPLSVHHFGNLGQLLLILNSAAIQTSQ